jgi:hypothetical protein
MISDIKDMAPQGRTSLRKLTTGKFLKRAAFLFFLPACVSVSIGPGKPQAAKNVKYKTPPSPYESFESDDVDAGWKNSKKGTSISYKSSCGDALDLPLEGIQQSMLSGIDKVKILRSQRVPYNEREALDCVAKGKVDGVDTKLEIMILKKNRCTYMISYVAVLKSFDSDAPVFQDFLKSFEAP